MMTDDKDKWPSYADELSRKVTETVARWMERVDAGVAKKRDLFVLVDGLWDACSGLVHEDVLRMLEAIHEELRREARRRRADQ